MWGDALESSFDLSDFGAPGFELRERVDFSGHKPGNVVPHVNAELMNPQGVKIARDLTANQLPGFNFFVNEG